MTKVLATKYRRASKVRKRDLGPGLCRCGVAPQPEHKAIGAVVTTMMDRPTILAAIDRQPRADRSKPDSGVDPHQIGNTADGFDFDTDAGGDDARPRLFGIDLGRSRRRQFEGWSGSTIDVTDLATGWFETLSVREMAEKRVSAAVKEAAMAALAPVPAGRSWRAMGRRPSSCHRLEQT